MPSSVMDVIQRRLGDRVDEYRIPPPVFRAMHGEFLAFDLDGGWLTAIGV